VKKRTRVKVCCIASWGEARLAIGLGADALGLVGEMPSGPGVIDDDTARDIAQQVPPPIATFLLTARTNARDIVDHVRYCGTNTVQIVNHIEPGEYAAIASGLPTVRRVQVIHVEDDSALDRVRAYTPFVHAFLLDSGKPNAAIAELGGTGRAHDWRISRKIVEGCERPVFLAGGLRSSNVADALATVGPYGLDLCSGVRSNGSLDAEKLTAFMQAL
jgi:phosphoribosylanthranilate isomerase